MHKKLLVLAVLSACAIRAAWSQTYRDSSGTLVAGVVALPYNFVPLPPGQHNLPLTIATALTVPAGSRYATLCASGAPIKYTTDGATTPTSSIGQPLLAGACVSLSGYQTLANFRAISPTGVLDVEYFQ